LLRLGVRFLQGGADSCSRLQTVPGPIGTPNSVSTSSSMPRLLTCGLPLRQATVAVRRGPKAWARTSSGIVARVTAAQQGQVRACPWCSVTVASWSGSSAT
jgi:hypothetical protein